MNPLMFVNWHAVGQRFVVLCWIAAIVLAIILLARVAPQSNTSRHHPDRPVIYGVH